MTARMPDGSEFDQHKTTLTTIRSLSEPDSAPAGSGAVASPASPPPRVALGTGETAAPSKNAPRK